MVPLEEPSKTTPFSKFTAKELVNNNVKWKKVNTSKKKKTMKKESTSLFLSFLYPGANNDVVIKSIFAKYGLIRYERTGLRSCVLHFATLQGREGARKIEAKNERLGKITGY